jgi:hypothetical protein
VKHQNKNDELQLLATDGLERFVRPKYGFTCFVRHRKFVPISSAAPERRVRRRTKRQLSFVNLEPPNGSGGFVAKQYR